MTKKSSYILIRITAISLFVERRRRSCSAYGNTFLSMAGLQSKKLLEPKRRKGITTSIVPARLFHFFSFDVFKPDTDPAVSTGNDAAITGVFEVAPTV